MYATNRQGTPCLRCAKYTEKTLYMRPWRKSEQIRSWWSDLFASRNYKL